VAASWSGDSKQLTLALGRLESDSRYGIVIPTSLKDLAKNPLEREYRAVFRAVAETKVADQAFTVTSTYPADKEALKPTQNPMINFSRPPQGFSALSAIVMDPKVEGYWEVTGSRLTFVHKEPFPVGASFTVGVPDTLTDLGGKRLDKIFRFGFTVKDYEGAAKDKKGRDQAVALLMEDFFNSYLQGDIGRLGSLLDPSFRMEKGAQFLSSQQFLDRIRREASEKSLLNAGFSAPVYKHDAATCSSKVALRKVASAAGQDTLWVQARTAPGILPKVFRGDKEIASGIAWSRTEPRFTLDGKDYVYDLPAASGPENAAADPRFLGEQLRLSTTVVLQPVKDAIKDEFTIDGGISVTETEARAAVKVSTVTEHGRSDWDPAPACADGAGKDTSFQILKFILGYTGTKWIVNHAVDGGKVEKRQFSQAVAASEFKVREIKPLNLLGPVGGIDGAGDAAGKITLRFRGLDFDSVGGYLLGLAEDPKFTGGRPLFGALYFIRTQGKGSEHRLIVDASAQPVSGGTAILRDVQALQLPGWERVNFKFQLTELFNASKGLAGVYQWKVIAVRDTSAAQFLANGFQAERYYGESDFGASRGSFAVKGYPNASDFSKLDNQDALTLSQAKAQESFTDRDLDGFTDFMEANYRTNPDDKGSFPNFLVDTDRDGIADFLEQMIDASGIEREATEAGKKDFFEALAALGVKWTDADGDGVPDDIEKLLGYDPGDAASKPATRARVSAPSGVYSGLIKLGDNAYPLKFKVRAQQDTLLVSYSAYLKDTLTDTVAASLNESMGEFLFPVRLPDNGPDSGKSLLLRGTYDKNRAFLQGVANRIASVPRLSTAFAGGPFVGQYAASGRGEDVSGYLDIQKAAPAGTTVPVATQPASGGTATVSPSIVMAYRKPPSGLGNARFSLRQSGSKLFILTLKDEFGDEVAVLDSTHSYNQDDGSFDISARMTRTDAAKQSTRRIEVNARLGRGKDSTAEVWVLDGSLIESLDSCRKFDANAPSKCTDRLYRDVPGQFSAKVPVGDASVKVFTNGVAGDFAGWLQQDKFGTGLSDGNAAETAGGGAIPGGTAADPTPPESFSKPYAGTAAKFRVFLDQAGIGQGDAFYLSMRGRVMRTVNDTLHVRDGAFPYCGNVRILPTPIPLLDGATAQEKKDFTRDSILAVSSKYAVLAIEDDLLPGTPAKLAKARDALGFVRTNVFLIESRYVDPNAFVGGKCLDGGTLPPPFPLDAGLPALPSGYEYFRGDLETLRAALEAAGNKITVVKDGSAATAAREINPATLRIDPDSRAGMAADVEDPSLGYVLLGVQAKAGMPKLVNGLPAALAR
ncbi:MAG TPA: Ig-like domain-containing protein, partial [Fibrobacteria bacterium]|nr:Ig-like domain-containing protein [Fibrobacteria bacterium]